MRVTEGVAREPGRLVVTPPVVSPRTFASSASGRWAEVTVRVGVALTGTGLVWGAPHSIYGLLGAASALVGPVCVWSCGRVGEPPGGSSHRSNSSKPSALEERASPFHGMAWAKSSNSCGGPPDTSAAPPFHRPSARSPLRRSLLRVRAADAFGRDQDTSCRCGSPEFLGTAPVVAVSGKTG